MKNCRPLKVRLARIRQAKQVHKVRAGKKKHFFALNLVLGRAGNAVKGKVVV